MALSESASNPTDVSDLLERAKKLATDQHPPISTKPALINTNSSDLTEARAVLDRYYAISAESQNSSITQSPKKQEVKVQENVQVKPKPIKVIRRPPSEVFQEFNLDDIKGPTCIKYVICGGGTAAWAAIEAILDVDPNAAKDILLITEEPYYPYNRTVLSKELWEGDKKDVFQSEEATRSAVEFGYKGITNEKISIVTGQRIERLDVDDKSVVFADGHYIHFDKFLLATGGVPKGPKSVSATLGMSVLKEKVGVFRRLDDYRSLRENVEKEEKGVVVIGGGFLGTELAIALSSVSDNVTLVMTEVGVLCRVLPRYLSEFLAKRIKNIGVKVIRSAIVTDAFINPDDEEVVSMNVGSPDAEVVEGGRVVVAVGIEPAVELAKEAGLELDKENGGVRVNDFMMVEPDVFAAGDVASFHDRSLGRRRVEHFDQACKAGAVAGANMAGKRKRYSLQSMFWSDLTNVGVHFTAVGLVDSSLDTIGVWNLAEEGIDAAPSANEYTRGVVYYMKDGGVVGVLLWNPMKGSGALRKARALVAAKTRIEELSEKTMGDLVGLGERRHATTIRTRGIAGML